AQTPADPAATEVDGFSSSAAQPNALPGGVQGPGMGAVPMIRRPMAGFGPEGGMGPGMGSRFAGPEGGMGPGMGGRGAGPEGGGMGGGGSFSQPGQSNTLAKGVDYKLLRFFDYSVEPGKKYKYRVKLVLADPNVNIPSNMLAPAVLDRLAKAKDAS